MKRLRFKTPFNGMDNALRLIPESYKVNGKEFELTDGIESYRVRWEKTPTILTASNKNLMNEDMQKMKHLMQYNSKDTLGNLRGKERINENKVFNDVWDKTKKLIKEGDDEYHHQASDDTHTQTVIIPHELPYEFNNALEGFFEGSMHGQDLVPGDTYSVYVSYDDKPTEEFEFEVEKTKKGDKLRIANVNNLGPDDDDDDEIYEEDKKEDKPKKKGVIRSIADYFKQIKGDLTPEQKEHIDKAIEIMKEINKDNDKKLEEDSTDGKGGHEAPKDKGDDAKGRTGDEEKEIRRKKIR